MKKSLMLVAVSVAVSAAGCDKREDVQRQEQQLAETQAKAAEQRAEIAAEAREEKMQADEKASEKMADVREDVAEAKQDVVEAKRDLAGADDATHLSGTLHSSSRKELTVRDFDGRNVTFAVDETTRTRQNGRVVALSEVKEGTAVRTSFEMKNGNRVAREIEILDQKGVVHGHSGTRSGKDSMDIPTGK